MHDIFNASTWLLDRNIESGRGDHVAIRSQGFSHSYTDTLALVERVATGLRIRGVRPEERVAMVMLDTPEFVATFLGAMRIGAVPVLTNPLLPARDLAVIVADSRARHLVISADRAAVLDDLRASCPELTDVIVSGSDDWAELIVSGEDGAPYATWRDSPGFWLCTSGTTGRPKLAMHTHGDLSDTCTTYADQVLGIGPDDRCFSVGPLFHAYGLGNSLSFPFSVGATTILEPTRPPTPQLIADIVSEEMPTLFFCIPTFYAAMTNAPANVLPDDTFASVRWAVSAAEALPAETFERFRSRFGVTILDGIGSTELLHIFLSNTPDRQKPGTSGVAVPGYQLRIVDLGSGEDCGDDEPGQLLVRGESAAFGYWCRSDQTRATFAGEWVRTGDRYVRDTDGFYTHLGRADDMLRVGGEWVSPVEVESTLIANELVLEAAVVGRANEMGATRPIAFVIPAPGADEDHEAMITALTTWCKERLAGYKRPNHFEIVTELPKTATGKIQRFKLR